MRHRQKAVIAQRVDPRQVAQAIRLPSPGPAPRRVVTVAVVDTHVDSEAVPGDVMLPEISAVNVVDDEHHGEPTHATQMARILVALLRQATAVDALRILPIAVCRHGSCGLDTLERGLRAAFEHRAHVVLLSLGGLLGTASSGALVQDGVTRLTRAGAVVISAVANSGVYGHSFPACARGVLPVAACDLAGRRLAISGYCADVARRGVLAPGRIQLDARSEDAPIIGTSVAAAVTAAVAAVIRACRPDCDSAHVRYALWRSGRPGHSPQTMLDASAALSS